MIQVLPDVLINKIAAGEVIENPSSVIKELIENAVDAGATSITVEIKGGGFQLIRVQDNGVGMNPDDAILCLERHATSKITAFKDLESLESMGFRGEALASIASISKLTLITYKDSGTHIECEGGKILKVSKAVRTRGTTFEVRSLFYNVPARRKFQKSAASSTSAIIKMCSKLALCNENIHLRLISSNQEIFSVKGAGIERIRTILGKEFALDLQLISYSEGDCQVQGYIKPAIAARSNRTGQHIFVNGRSVFSPLLSLAASEAYGTRIETKKFPCFVLFITLSPKKVDVNVHPQKKEVRFQDPLFAKELVRKAICSGFSEKVTASLSSIQSKLSKAYQENKKVDESLPFSVASNSDETEKLFDENTSSFASSLLDDIGKIKIPSTKENEQKPNSFFEAHKGQYDESSSPETFVSYQAPDSSIQNLSDLSALENQKENASETVSAKLQDEKLVPAEILPEQKSYLQIRETHQIEKESSEDLFPFTLGKEDVFGIFQEFVFIRPGVESQFFQTDSSSLTLINLQRAEERIFFDKMMASEKLEVQKLLFPETLDFSLAEASQLEEFLPSFHTIGMEIRKFGKTSFIVETLPCILETEDMKDCILTLLEKFAKYQTLDPLATERGKAIFQTIKTFTKARKTSYTKESAIRLVKELQKCLHYAECPKGNPIVTGVDHDKLQLLFKTK